ncbi:MAG: amidohydrolase family protein [Candidatus Thermoplasmatota archaeon]|nr:amidohydrolase family protein [Candidatus Thermoplasmatota archaeon]
MAVPEDPVRYTDTVLVDDEQRLHRGDVLLHPDGRWSTSRGDEDVVETVDGRDRLITRSLQNWHTHLAMQLNARDFSDGYPLHRWLEEAIFPTEARLNPMYVETGARAAAAELLRTGCTFAADMYFHPEVTGSVLQEAGMRGLVGGPISDRALPSHDSAEDALRDLELLLANNDASDSVQYAIAAHSVYLCSDETLLKAKDVAERHGARIHIHVSETRKEIADCHERTGRYPVEHLDHLGVLNEGTVLAHASWVKKREIRMMAEAGATAVHCPSSNMKLACGGTLSMPPYLEAGVDVRLGTDGAASSGSGLNLLAEARLASLVQRHDHWDATMMTASQAFAMATRDSHDWVAWNLDDIRMHPRGRSDNRHLANLVFNGTDCLDVWAQGRALRRNGVTLSIDERAAASALNDAVESYYEDVE